MVVFAVAGLCFPLIASTVTLPRMDAEFNAILKADVRDGEVDYAKLKANPKPLDSYLSDMASVPQKEFEIWPTNQQLAFLINLYNATMLKLVADNYPVDTVKEIGTLFAGPFEQPVVQVFGKTMTLNRLEYQMIQSRYQEPGVYFALTRASKSCPPLRNEAYVGGRLKEQLNDQIKRFMARENRLNAERHVLYLSPIFRWYREALLKDYGSVQKFAERYLPETEAKELAQGGWAVDYTHFDWSLNCASGGK